MKANFKLLALILALTLALSGCSIEFTTTGFGDDDSSSVSDVEGNTAEDAPDESTPVETEPEQNEPEQNEPEQSEPEQNEQPSISSETGDEMLPVEPVESSAEDTTGTPAENDEVGLEDIPVDTSGENTLTQNGYSITVEGIILDEDRTRVYLTAENNGDNEIYLYEYNMSITQNGQSYSYDFDMTGDYPTIQSSIAPGEATEGVIVFPPLAAEPFTFVVKAVSGDYSEVLADYSFEVSINS